MEDRTFSGCSSLTDIVLPNSVESIGASCFYNCDNLKSISLPPTINSIDKECFYNCRSLNSIQLPSLLTQLKENTFGNCTSLKEVIIPSSVTTIGDGCFYSCKGIQHLELGNSLQLIGSQAFLRCSSLIDVVCHAEVPPSLFKYANGFFEHVNLSNVKLFVPASSVSIYKSTTPWSNFGTITSIGSHNLTLLHNEGGKILLNDEEIVNNPYTLSVVPNEAIVLAYIPNSGYSIKNVILNNEDKGVVEGHTLDGLDEDTEIKVYFTPNKYKLIYMVDEIEYKSYEVEYGSIITPESALTKEGYTFLGWSEIPETMPAHDVTVTGTFCINSYKLTYMIDDKVYKETMYKYGTTITPEPQPEGDYATFEWEDLPQTMPAHDVTVNASYISGIIEVLMAEQRNLRIYSPNGKKLSKLQKGLNIVIFDDGTVKKVMMK